MLVQLNNSEMNKVVKTKISGLLEEIDDEAVLNLLMEEVSFYASKKDIVDGLDERQLKELDEAIEEADNKETISWEDFKKEINEWRKK
jgi:CRISPR/Cas system CMR-associated protein Cmr5 small subunit